MQPLLAAVLLFSPSQDEPKRALQAQQGTWSAVSSRRDGQDADAEIVKSIVRVVEGDRAVWSRDGKRFAATKIELDPTTQPASIDAIPEGGPNRDQRILGIYKLEDDTLVICMADAGQPRPTEFSAERGEAQTLMVFRRKASESDRRRK